MVGPEGRFGLNGFPESPTRTSGVTLIELLVAMSLLGVAIAIASMIFVSGHKQVVGRWRETQALDSAWLMRTEFRDHCQDSLSGILVVSWGRRMDSCLYYKTSLPIMH
jgi:prepilin-type N-terminal cleavage/methylation domain-containing protein